MRNWISIHSGASLAVFLGACTPTPPSVANSDQSAQKAPANQGNHVNDQTLPPNQRFATLDQYLEWLRLHEAPVDGAWYEEVRPGVYALHKGGNLHLDTPSEDNREYTKAELAQKLGFTR